MSSLNPEQILSMPVGDLAAMTGESLFDLKNSATELSVFAKRIAERIDQAIEIKYSVDAHQQRLAAGKDTGVVHLNDGDLQITADLPKKVEWDQVQLADIAKRIVASGGDPNEYIDISYKVSETKFSAWPESIRSGFESARTLKTGKPSFRIALLKGDSK
jgi:hypothetical protein